MELRKYCGFSDCFHSLLKSSTNSCGSVSGVKRDWYPASTFSYQEILSRIPGSLSEQTSSEPLTTASTARMTFVDPIYRQPTLVPGHGTVHANMKPYIIIFSQFWPELPKLSWLCYFCGFFRQFVKYSLLGVVLMIQLFARLFFKAFTMAESHCNCHWSCWYSRE